MLFLCFGINESYAQWSNSNLRSIQLPESQDFFSAVNCVVETPDGLMWFATSNGVYGYDGFLLTSYSKSDSIHKIPENDIKLIVPYVNGELLLLSTTGSIFILNYQNNFTEQLNSPFTATEFAYSLVNTTSGIFVSGNKGGVFQLKGKSWVNVVNKALNKTIRLSFVQGDKLWMGTENPDKIGYLDLQSGKITLLADGVGVWLWKDKPHYVDIDGGLYSWKQEHFKKLDDLETDGIYLRYGFDDGNRVWLADGDLRFFSYNDQGELKDVCTFLKETFGKKKLYSAYLDKSGDLWIGSSNEIFIIKKQRPGIIPVLSDPLLKNDEVGYSSRAVYQVSDTTLLLTTYSGWFNYNINSGLLSERKVIINGDPYRAGTLPLMEIVKLDDDKVLAVAESDYIGLWELKTDNYNSLTPSGSTVTEHLICIEKFKENSYLAGGERGLYLYDYERDEYQALKVKGLDNALPLVWDIEIDSSGKAWVGAEEGLFYVTPSYVAEVVYSFPKDLRIHDIHSYKDILFVGTANGLYSLEGNIFKTYLKGYNIFSISEKDGWLWMGTEKGLVRFDIKNGDHFLFTSNEGLPFNEFNRKSNALLNNEVLVFGGLNGYTLINADELLRHGETYGDIQFSIKETTHFKDTSNTYINDTLISVFGGISQISFKSKNSILRPPFIVCTFYKNKWRQNSSCFLHLNSDTLDEDELKVKLRFPNGTYSNTLTVKVNKDGASYWGWLGLFFLPILIIPFYLQRKKSAGQHALGREDVDTLQLNVGKSMSILLVPPVKLPEWDVLEKIYALQWEVLTMEEEHEMSVAQLAGKLHISERQFYRFTKEFFELTPLQYINGLKLSKSLYLIYNDDVNSVDNLAQQCGFKKASYFSSLFKERFGKSPKQIIKSRNALTK